MPSPAVTNFTTAFLPIVHKMIGIFLTCPVPDDVQPREPVPVLDGLSYLLSLTVGMQVRVGERFCRVTNRLSATE